MIRPAHLHGVAEGQRVLIQRVAPILRVDPNLRLPVQEARRRVGALDEPGQASP